MNKLHKQFAYILAVLLCLAAQAAQSAPVSIKAKLDSVQMLMGTLNNLTLEVVQDKNAKGELALFKNVNLQIGYVPVCNDSVELRTSFTRDTVDLGSGRVQINYKIPVQAFDSGFYQLPQFIYVSGRDTARSNVVSLKVMPVPGLTAKSPLVGYADVMDPPGRTFFDKVPDVIYNFWWLILLALAVIAATILLIIRYRTQGTLLPAKPKPKPYDVAMQEMNALKAQKLWEGGHDREYFTRLTDILRTYLEGRFGINAMEMTTRQIEEKISADSRIRDKKKYVSQVLAIADFVKFAGARPLAEDNVKSFDNAMNFIQETKPTPDEEAAEKAAAEEAAKAATLAARRHFFARNNNGKNVRKSGKGKEVSGKSNGKQDSGNGNGKNSAAQTGGKKPSAQSTGNKSKKGGNA